MSIKKLITNHNLEHL